MDIKIEPRLEKGLKGETPVVHKSDTKKLPEKKASETAKNADNNIKGFDQTSLRYNVEKVTDHKGHTEKKLIVTVIDEQTGKVIRRIPPEEITHKANFMGIMVDKKG
ncbi:MAG: flagellar protein FlaG [Candidatus Aureabacteria bacterium]|nr:flagellar protein FlaG [Candidatus Auribacterota bacterium]